MLVAGSGWPTALASTSATAAACAALARAASAAYLSRSCSSCCIACAVLLTGSEPGACIAFTMNRGVENLKVVGGYLARPMNWLY